MFRRAASASTGQGVLSLGGAPASYGWPGHAGVRRHTFSVSADLSSRHLPSTDDLLARIGLRALIPVGRGALARLSTVLRD